MTCIAGIVSNGIVYIGGDSAGIAGDSLRHRKDEKVFELKNNLDTIIFGFTTSFRMGQLLRYGFNLPNHPKNMSNMEYLCTLFIDSIRNRFKAGGWLERRNDMECGGTFLVGYRGGLYYVGSDFQVGETIKNFDSVGSGREVAIGALHVLEHISDMSPEEKITKSLEAAEHHLSTVAGPFTIVSTKKKIRKR